MNGFVKLLLVIGVAVVGTAWTHGVEAQQTRDAVAKARGQIGKSADGRTSTSRASVSPRVAAAAQPASNSYRTYSYDPSRLVTSRLTAPSVVGKPQSLGFHDAGAKVRGEFGK